MPNMAVAYQRPNRSLITLRDEVYRAYDYTPARASEFVTGYKSPTNFTGHNADSNGIVHAIDIFTDDNGNLPEAQGRELAEKLRAIGRATGRFSYLIHDMSPGAPDPRIAGAFSGWEWQPYAGESPHSDHIHVSTVDLYWGDPVNFPAAVYDSTEPWGIAGITNAGGAVRPIETKDWFDMVTSKDLDTAVEKGLAKYLGPISTASGDVSVRQMIADGTRAAQTARDNTGPITRGGRPVSLRQEIADTKTGNIALQGQIAGLLAAFKAATTGQNIDLNAVQAAAKAGAEEALKSGVDVNVNVGGTNG
ncbi:hypothetical protein C6401_15135 [Arthrobacter woluwensis]|uniref:hypothetical protein n=1 Tax=Arthrobacter woluwensis TaxID=156980 RepID=UPI000D1386FE|nr:hypothetical protein [Arthrobacter woluwensis]PSS42891.1 hypothetical protein C6401_15135 [Arthrobacter woluwensis]